MIFGNSVLILELLVTGFSVGLVPSCPNQIRTDSDNCGGELFFLDPYVVLYPQPFMFG